jgi:uncharacterized membrane protein YbhN (UPF0104 family)
VAVNLLTIPLRTQRWRLMFSRPSRPTFGRLTAIMLIGQAINLFIPARAGDLVRATLVETEKTAYALGTQLLILALDLLMLATLVLVLLFQVRLPLWWRGPGEALLVMAALALIGVAAVGVGRMHITRLLVWLRDRWPWARGRGIFEPAVDFFRSFVVFASPGLMLFLLFLTVVIWALYAAVNWLLLGALDPSLDGSSAILASVFLLVVLQLSIAVPSSPGRVGVYHFLAVQALAVFSVDQATAVSYAILLHLISVILPAAIGALLAWKMDFRMGRSAQESGA